MKNLKRISLSLLIIVLSVFSLIAESDNFLDDLLVSVYIINSDGTLPKNAAGTYNPCTDCGEDPSLLCNWNAYGLSWFTWAKDSTGSGYEYTDTFYTGEDTWNHNYFDAVGTEILYVFSTYSFKFPAPGHGFDVAELEVGDSFFIALFYKNCPYGFSTLVSHRISEEDAATGYIELHVVLEALITCLPPHICNWEPTPNYISLTSTCFVPTPLTLCQSAINEAPILPNEYYLSENTPNPFNSATEISYGIAKDSDVRVDIFNIAGQKISTLVNDFQTSGRYTVKWDGKDEYGKTVATGTYFYSIKAGDFEMKKKMLYIK